MLRKKVVDEALHELHLRAEAAHVVGGLVEEAAVLHVGAAGHEPPQRVGPRGLPRLPGRRRALWILASARRKWNASMRLDGGEREAAERRLGLGFVAGGGG